MLYSTVEKCRRAPEDLISGKYSGKHGSEKATVPYIFFSDLICEPPPASLDNIVAMTSQPAAGSEPSPLGDGDDYTPTFYVGHHESKRPLPVTEFVLRQAQDVGVSTPRWTVDWPVTRC